MTTINTDYNSTYLTQSWLDSHSGAQQVLDSNPDFVSFLSSNPDYAKSFTDSPEGAQEAVQAAVDSGAIENEAMGRLLGNASLTMGTLGAQDQTQSMGTSMAEGEALFKDYNDSVTKSWLQEHPGAALLLDQHKELADFLDANPEYAEDFVSGSDGATKAVEALIAQQPELGLQVSDLVPSGEATVQDSNGQNATATNSSTTESEQTSA